MQNFSLLQHKPLVLDGDPFPYAVIEGALPDELYLKLASTFPTSSVTQEMLQKENHRVDLISSWGPSIYPASFADEPWQQFIRQHSHNCFARQVVNLFMDSLESLGDRLHQPMPRLFRPFAGTRSSFDPDSIKVRVTLAVNTPSTECLQVRGPHVDNKLKAFVGLYYLREEGDSSVGGDLCLYRWRDSTKRHPRWPKKIDDGEVEVLRTVRYEANKLVIFMNTDNSIHGVTHRDPSSAFRRFVVVSGWFSEGFRQQMSRKK